MINPTEIPIEVGVYYLLVRPVVDAGVNFTNASVFVTTIAAQCLYWDEMNGNWSRDGCRVRTKYTYTAFMLFIHINDHSRPCLWFRLVLALLHRLLSACAPI